jgi:hypothetical protein
MHSLSHPLSLYTFILSRNFLSIKESKRKALKEARFGKIEVFDSLKGVIASFISFLLLLPIFVMDLSMRE